MRSPSVQTPADAPGSTPTASGDPASADAVLVARLRAGDPRAFEALFARYATQLHRILLHVLGPEPEVPDLLHDVFVSAFERIGALKEPQALGAWLAAAAVNAARSFIRRRTRFWRWPTKSAETLSPSPQPPPDVSTALRLTYAILERMPASERIPFALRVIDGMQLDEIAAACGHSIPTVKRRLRRADERFRRLAALHPVLHTWLQELP